MKESVIANFSTVLFIAVFVSVVAVFAALFCILVFKQLRRDAMNEPDIIDIEIWSSVNDNLQR